MKSCILLCGGESRRMGKDKGSMIIHDKPMILHILLTLKGQINELVIVLNDSHRISEYKKIIKDYKFDYEIKFVEDIIKNKGPLSGILTGLNYITKDYALCLPCDSPYITKNLINYLFNQIDEKYSGIVPYHDSNNKIKSSEPLHSIYKKNNIVLIEKLLNEDILNVKALIEKINCKFIKIDNEKIFKENFKNLNTPEDVLK